MVGVHSYFRITPLPPKKADLCIFRPAEPPSVFPGTPVAHNTCLPASAERYCVLKYGGRTVMFMVCVCFCCLLPLHYCGSRDDVIWGGLLGRRVVGGKGR